MSSNSNLQQETRSNTQNTASIQSSSNMGEFSKINSSVNNKLHVDEFSNNIDLNNQNSLFSNDQQRYIFETSYNDSNYEERDN